MSKDKKIKEFIEVNLNDETYFKVWIVALKPEISKQQVQNFASRLVQPIADIFENSSDVDGLDLTH